MDIDEISHPGLRDLMSGIDTKLHGHFVINDDLLRNHSIKADGEIATGQMAEVHYLPVDPTQAATRPEGEPGTLYQFDTLHAISKNLGL